MSARTGRRIHLIGMLVWLIVGLPVSYLLRQELWWVVTLQVYSIVTGHWSGWSSERPNQD